MDTPTCVDECYVCDLLEEFPRPYYLVACEAIARLVRNIYSEVVPAACLGGWDEIIDATSLDPKSQPYRALVRKIRKNHRIYCEANPDPQGFACARAGLLGLLYDYEGKGDSRYCQSWITMAIAEMPAPGDWLPRYEEVLVEELPVVRMDELTVVRVREMSRVRSMVEAVHEAVACGGEVNARLLLEGSKLDFGEPWILQKAAA